MAWLGAKLGKWLAAAGAVALAIAAALAYGWRRGSRSQADRDDAKAARIEAAAANSARQTRTEADDAAAEVLQAAASQTPPDPDQRHDFESKF